MELFRIVDNKILGWWLCWCWRRIQCYGHDIISHLSPSLWCILTSNWSQFPVLYLICWFGFMSANRFFFLGAQEGCWSLSLWTCPEESFLRILNTFILFLLCAASHLNLLMSCSRIIYWLLTRYTLFMIMFLSLSHLTAVISMISPNLPMLRDAVQHIEC